jgi:hypothetical protein
VLVEIEAYPDADADRQVFEDIQIVSLVRGVVPDTICLVLKPKGHANVAGHSERLSHLGSTRLTAAWKVIELWQLKAEDLLERNDPGLIPWVPLTQSNADPKTTLKLCQGVLDRVQDDKDRIGLLAVTDILSVWAYGRHSFNLFGGFHMALLEKVLQDPVFDELKERIVEIRSLNRHIHRILQKRFGIVPRVRIEALFDVMDEQRQDELMELAMTCPDLETFVHALVANQS